MSSHPVLPLERADDYRSSLATHTVARSVNPFLWGYSNLLREFQQKVMPALKAMDERRKQPGYVPQDNTTLGTDTSSGSSLRVPPRVLKMIMEELASRVNGQAEEEALSEMLSSLMD